MELSLGFANAAGREGLEQCQDFKDGIWRRIGRNHPGAFLKTVHQEERSGLVVEFDGGVEGAAAWARQAYKLQDEVWQEVQASRSAGIRIPATRAL